jgi:hypothetical protein
MQFLGFYALETPIIKKTGERFKDRIGPVPMYVSRA